MVSTAIVHWTEEIRRLRRASGLKQAALAEALDVDQATVSRWERGAVVPGLRMQRRIRDLLHRYNPDESLILHGITQCPGMALISNARRVMQAVSASCARAHGLPQHEMPGRCNRGKYGASEWMFEEIARRGFYRGEVASVTGVCRVVSLSGHRPPVPVKAVWIPVRVGDEILLRADRVHLSEETFEHEVARNGGPLRFVMMDDLVR